MHLPLFVLHDPTILRHMAGAGHYIRLAFYDATIGVCGPYTADMARNVAHVFKDRLEIAEAPRVASFEELAEGMEAEPGRRWYWLGTRDDGLHAVIGPFKSRREAHRAAAKAQAAAQYDPGRWKAVLHYDHEPEAYPRRRRST